jgi:RNA polymerase sigma factor (sigma-70 family)
MTPIVSELFLRTQPDERLVRLARGGHDQAFAAIVSRYQRELLAFARAAGPEARAEDVVQQALLSAFVALRRGTEVTHLRGWLYTIVRNGLVRAAAGAPMLDADADRVATTEPLEDVVLRRARARDVLTAVRGLPSRQRTALVATVFHGQRRAEVARTLGQSEGAVRQLVHRARHNVRNAVGAVTPAPLVRWLLPLRAGSPAGGPAAELAGSSAMDSTVGVVAKLGAVLASGALATGIVAVPLRSAGSHHHGAAVRAVQVGLAPVASASARRTISASAGPEPAGVRLVSGSLSAMPRASAGRRERLRSGRGAGGAGGAGSRGDRGEGGERSSGAGGSRSGSGSSSRSGSGSGSRSGSGSGSRSGSGSSGSGGGPGLSGESKSADPGAGSGDGGSSGRGGSSDGSPGGSSGGGRSGGGGSGGGGSGGGGPGGGGSGPSGG